MSSRSTTVVGLIVSILIIGAVASIGYYQFEVAPNAVTTSSTTSAQASCTPSTCANVTIVQGAATSGAGFDAQTITVVLGHNATVYWTNNDSAIHTVTTKSGSPVVFDSGNISPGAAFHYSFVTAGTYTYGCDYHSNMRGTVIVKP